MRVLIEPCYWIMNVSILSWSIRLSTATVLIPNQFLEARIWRPVQGVVQKTAETPQQGAIGY